MNGVHISCPTDKPQLWNLSELQPHFVYCRMGLCWQHRSIKCRGCWLQSWSCRSFKISGQQTSRLLRRSEEEQDQEQPTKHRKLIARYALVFPLVAVDNSFLNAIV